MTDLMTVLVNFGSQITPIIKMLQYFAAFAGLWYVFVGLTELWGVSHDNASKFLAGGKNYSVGSALVKLTIGGMFAAMGTLEMVGIFSRTMTDDYAAARFLAYTPTDSSLDQQRIAATAALMGIMQVVGFVALWKGMTTIISHAEGQPKAGLGQAAGWLIGGIVTWNFQWFTSMMNCTLGFNIIGMFGASAFTPATCSLI